MIDADGRLVEPGGLVEASAGTEREFVEPLLEYVDAAILEGVASDAVWSYLDRMGSTSGPMNRYHER